MARQAGEPAVQKWMAALYESPAARVKALQAMWRSKDPAFHEHFPRSLRDPDIEVRREALTGIGELELAAPCEPTRLHLDGLLEDIERISGGLSDDERGLVEGVLNLRLEGHGDTPPAGGRGAAPAAPKAKG